MKPLHARSVAAVLLFFAALAAAGTHASGKPPAKKLIHAGYPAEVGFVRRNIEKMKALPFDGTILIIHELSSLFNHDHKVSRKQVQRQFDDLAATDFGRLTENFLKLNVEQYSDIDWFNDEQWAKVEHNIRLATEAVVAAKARGIVFDPEQYQHRLWVYEKAEHHATRSFEEYTAQMRKRGAQWMKAVQSVKPDSTLLHYYLLTAFNSYYGVRDTPGGDTPHLEETSYGLYLGFINGMLDAAGPDVTFVDGNESAYYYGGRAEYDGAYVQIRQERLYLIAPENRAKYRRQVQAGSALYIQGTMGMRNYSIQALGTFLEPPDRLKLMEHRAYQALRTADEYVWCYSGAATVSWWTDRVPDGVGTALASAKRKIAAGAPLGLDETPFEKAKRRQLDLMKHGRASVVPRRAVVRHVGSDGPPRIDGKLDDSIWQRVKALDPFQVPNIFTKPKLHAPTEARVAWDDENLYVAFLCHEPLVDRMSARAKAHDGRVWNDDCVEVFISAGAELYPYRHFEINSIDTHFDAVWAAFRKMDKTWSAEWRSASSVGTDRWISEVAIPWTVIGTRPRPGEWRRANVTRHRIPDEIETTTWTPMYKTFADADYMGTWVFEGE